MLAQLTFPFSGGGTLVNIIKHHRRGCYTGRVFGSFFLARKRLK